MRNKFLKIANIVLISINLITLLYLILEFIMVATGVKVVFGAFTYILIVVLLFDIMYSIILLIYKYRRK